MVGSERYAGPNGPPEGVSMNDPRKRLVKDLIAVVVAASIGAAAVILIVYLAGRNSLPNPISFSLVLYAAPLLIPVAFIMFFGAIADYLRATGRAGSAYVRIIDWLSRLRK